MHTTIKKLYFEPTSRCNLNCVMCFRHTWIDEGFGDLPMELFYKVMDDEEALKDTHTVFFGGMGEPLVHPNIFEMVAYVKSKGKKVEMITNGTMLTDEVSKKLIEAGLSKLWISVDSFDEESYKHIQVGSRFGLIMQNIQTFNKNREGTDVKLGIGVVLMKSNLAQLKSLEAFYEEIHADDVNLSHMIPNTEDAIHQTLWQYSERADKIISDEAAFRDPTHFITEIGDDSCSGYQEAGENDFIPTGEANNGFKPTARFRFVKADFERFEGLEDLVGTVLNENLEMVWRGEVPMRTKNRCRFIAEGNCFVRWDGDVSPCMGLLHSSNTYFDRDERTIWHYSFGNINDMTLSEIWNTDEYAEFRDRVMYFDFAPCVECGGCELRDENKEDCYGNEEPTCGACLWGQDFIRCP